jgi:CRISPR-associated protein Csb1
MNNELNQAPRLLLEARLKPVQGDRLQPTGFADLGAAVYERPDGKRMLLVESAQSVANRLEHACLEPGTARLDPALDGLPWVLVKLTKGGQAVTETSSLFEAHRINSPFIIANDAFKEKFRAVTGYAKGQPLNWPKVARGIFSLDPCSLLHGVFMANFEDGRIKIPRALTGFIEAEDVREVHSGGVKNNPIDPTGTLRAEGYDKDVYSNVPYHRTEYVAGKITAYFNLDLAVLRGYALGPDALALFVNLAIYKVRRFLREGLRLRTACDLAVDGDLCVTAPPSLKLSAEQEALKAAQAAIAACAKAGLFAKPPVTELTTPVVQKEKKEEGAKVAAEAPESQE